MPAEPIQPEVRALLERHGLLARERGHLMWSRFQRHHSMLIDDGTGRTFFVKRRGAPLVVGAVDLSQEFVLYELLRQGVLPEALRDFVPAYFAGEASDSILVVEGAPERATLADAFRTNHERLGPLCAFLGLALGLLHGSSRPEKLTHITLPVQTFGNYTPEMLAHGPRPTAELLKLVQSEPALNEQLRQLRLSWRHIAVIHGDVKSDNILVPKAADEKTPPWLVDWELFGIGDPAWDCGSLLGSLFYMSLENMRVGISKEDASNLQQRVFHAYRDFFRAYEQQRMKNIDFDAELESRLALRWAGYWLIQRVLVQLPLRRSLAAVDVSALHLAFQLLLEGASLGKVA